MIIDNVKGKEKVLALLLMRFKVSPKDSLEITKEWFNNNPDSDWIFLDTCLRNNLVRLKNNQLINLYDQHITILVNDLRNNNGLEIKDRRYHLSIYPKCFIGSDAVKWIENKYLLSKFEAIRLGQQLIDLKIIHHVTDDHDFKSDNLFYRFYMDE